MNYYPTIDPSRFQLSGVQTGGPVSTPIRQQDPNAFYAQPVSDPQQLDNLQQSLSDFTSKRNGFGGMGGYGNQGGFGNQGGYGGGMGGYGSPFGGGMGGFGGMGGYGNQASPLQQDGYGGRAAFFANNGGGMGGFGGGFNPMMGGFGGGFNPMMGGFGGGFGGFSPMMGGIGGLGGYGMFGGRFNPMMGGRFGFGRQQQFGDMRMPDMRMSSPSPLTEMDRHQMMANMGDMTGISRVPASNSQIDAPQAAMRQQMPQQGGMGPGLGGFRSQFPQYQYQNPQGGGYNVYGPNGLFND